MRPWSRWIGVGAALGAIFALVPVVQGRIDLDTPLHKLARVKEPAPPKLDGLDLPASRRPPTARHRSPLGRPDRGAYPRSGRAARRQGADAAIPDPRERRRDARRETGPRARLRELRERGEKFDVNVRAGAPAASIFKVVTGAALVEHAGLSSETEQCYHGGKSRIEPDELEDDPRRDKWCATLGIAMGRSLNVVFGKLAQKHLTPEDLTQAGGAFGFGSPVPFAVPNQPTRSASRKSRSSSRAPPPVSGTPRSRRSRRRRSLRRSRTAASRSSRASCATSRRARTCSGPTTARRAWCAARLKPETAAEVSRMMLQTVSNGSAYKSFHDEQGRAYLPGVNVAGKTGTLTDHKNNRHYTWFVGFAPAEAPEVAFSTLVVNTPTWHIKAPQLAREVLRAYFAKQNKPGITAP